jgi:hypothetical protein
VFVLMQLVPYGWWHENPPVQADAPWPDADSAALARDACYSCHSNETDWPLYSYVAPMSWLVRADVESGRDELNFSDWEEDGDRADKAAEAVADGEMPPRRFKLLHPEARLSDDEADQLIAALDAMNADRRDSSGPDAAMTATTQDRAAGATTADLPPRPPETRRLARSATRS